MKVNKTAVILISFFMLLSIAFLGYYYTTMKEHPRRLPTYGNPGHKVGRFSFLNQDGKVITEKDVEGKIYVVEYFFTTCQGICPIMNDNMVSVYNAFKNDNEIAILSHTVDPEIDTVAQMKKYSLKFDAEPARWMFLTGEKDSLYKMAVDDYLIPVADSTVEKITPEFIHTQKFVLIDKEKNVRGFYDGTEKTSVAKLIVDINELKKEYK